jgi:hypothetical protein
VHVHICIHKHILICLRIYVGIVLGLDDVAIGLELNHLNTQSCMRSLIRIILRMNSLFGSHDDENVRGGITGICVYIYMIISMYI